MRTHKPVHDINVMAVLLNQHIAGKLAIKEPVSNPLFLRIMAFLDRRTTAHPRRPHLADPSQFARLHDRIGLPVLSAVALLIVHRNPLGWVRASRRPQKPQHPGRIHASRLLTKDVLLRLHRPLKMFRVQKRRSRDQDRVDAFIGQHLIVRVKALRPGIFLRRRLKPVFIDIVECGYPGVLVFSENSAYVHASVPAAN